MRSFTSGDKQTEADAATIASSKSSTTIFPDIDDSQFSATQKQVLTVLKKEFAKHPTGYDKNVLKYTEGFKESWCADFISWVMNDAGAPFERQDNDYWRIPGVVTLQDYYKDYGAYHDAGSYTPRMGDVAFYIGQTPDGSSEEHVAIVLAVQGDTVVTIGGNESDQHTVQVRYDKLKAGEKGLVGFGASEI